MDQEYITAVTQVSELNARLKAEGRGIFDAARNTDLLIVTELLLKMIDRLPDEPVTKA